MDMGVDQTGKDVKAARFDHLRRRLARHAETSIGVREGRIAGFGVPPLITISKRSAIPCSLSAKPFPRGSAASFLAHAALLGKGQASRTSPARA